MKAYILTLFILLNISGFSQTTDAFNSIEKEQVPKAVQLKFEEMEPKSTVEDWKIFDRTYEAKFKSNKNWTFHRFNDEGGFLESRVLLDWETNATERQVEEVNKTYYKYWKVIKFYKITSYDHKVYYIVQLENQETGELETLNLY